jgi:hypothetical protein
MMVSRTSSTWVLDRWCSTAVVLVLAACPGDETSGDGTPGDEAGTGTSTSSADASTGDAGHMTTSGAEAESSSEDDTSNEPPPAECDCVTMSESWLGVGWTCELDEECPPVEVSCPDADLKSCAFGDLTVMNPEVLACHAEQLAADEPAIHRWELPYVTDPGVMGQRHIVLTLGGGHAITVHEAWDDASYVVGDAKLVTLRSASHFESCLDESSDEAVFACLYDVAEAEQGICLDGWTTPLG